jgi:hypothetical protein
MDPLAQNVLGPGQLLASGLNKTSPDENKEIEEGIGELEDAFTLKLDDDELLALEEQWISIYSSYEEALKLRQDAQKKAYLGKGQQGITVDGTPVASNLIFEAVETFLPAALSKNPEPVVFSDNTTEGVAISNDVKTMLQYHADVLALRPKLKEMARHWSNDFLGVMRHGWKDEMNDIDTEVVRATRLVLDKDAHIDSYGNYTGEYIGVRNKLSAQKLAEKFPKMKAFITISVNGKMATPCHFMQWDSDEYTFFTFRGKVMDKYKNPNFKYDTDEPELDPMGESVMDEDGKPVMTKKPQRNHFSKPKMLYTFLSVFNDGEHPHDMTGLIEQNIPNQNRINRRATQIDYNLSASNNSIALSEDNFNQETGKQFAAGRAKGNPLLVPKGRPIQEAYSIIPMTPVDGAHFTAQQHDEEMLRSIFGTQGISSQQPNEDTTARGMILNQQFDNSRIGGGIGDALEQVADNVFNCWVQLYTVFYDEKHFAAVLGRNKATEYITLTSQDIDRQLVVSVTPDSMKPHDEITEMNQAMSLWTAGAIDPKTLLTMLNVPDPQKTAESTVLWLIDKNAYIQLNFPEIAQQMAQLQAQQQAQQPQPGAAPPPGQGQPVPGSPDQTMAQDPASAALSNVQLPQ